MHWFMYIKVWKSIRNGWRIIKRTNEQNVIKTIKVINGVYTCILSPSLYCYSHQISFENSLQKKCWIFVQLELILD
jgi:hypothetical protein